MRENHSHRNYSQSLIFCVKHVEAVSESIVYRNECAESREVLLSNLNRHLLSSLAISKWPTQLLWERDHLMMARMVDRYDLVSALGSQ